MKKFSSLLVQVFFLLFLLGSEAFAGVENEIEFQESYLVSLPEEIQILVLSKLDDKERGRVASVCKTFHRLLDDPYLFSLKVTSDRLFLQKIAPEVYRRKVVGLAFGAYGYDKDPEAAVRLVEEGISQNKRWAFDMKATAVNSGLWGYKENRPLANSLVEQGVSRGERWAMRAKVWGLYQGTYGYQKEPKAAKRFIEAGVSQGKSWALRMRAWGLSSGMFGYKKGEKAYRMQLIEEGMSRGEPWAFDYHSRTLEEDERRISIENGISRGERWAFGAAFSSSNSERIENKILQHEALRGRSWAIQGKVERLNESAKFLIDRIIELDQKYSDQLPLVE
jgi:hypothetical protein